MDPEQIARRRMHNQHLWGDPVRSPVEVVRRLGAMQSQEFPFARWSVGQRSDGIDDSAMAQAFDEGAILRTHVLRPTWHFVAPDDIRWLLELTGPRVQAGNAVYHRKLGLDDRFLVQTGAAIADALQGKRYLTRKQVAEELARRGLGATGTALAFVMMHAELEGLVCSGPMSGKQHTYGLLDERTSKSRSLDRDEALTELTRRYFTAHGPATAKDFSWWSSLRMSDVRRGIDLIAPELDREQVEGRMYWFAQSDPVQRAAPGRVDLVQGYDEIIVSYSQSKDVLTGGVATGMDVYTHAILLDGRLVGHWRRVPTAGAFEIDVSTYRRLKRQEQDALADAIGRYGQFLGLPARVGRFGKL